MKKSITLILITCLMLLSGCQTKKELKDDIHIFFTSDVHCGVEENLGLAAAKAIVEDTKTEHDFVTFVDLGDYLQGGTYGSLSKGKIIIDIMNVMGYDYVAIGNHEFDYGLEELSKRMDEADFEFVICNVSYTGNGENIFKDTPVMAIQDYDGYKVAYIGVTTPVSVVTSTPKFFMEDGEFVYDFCSGNDGADLFAKVQETVDDARKEGADKVVILSHLGSELVNEPYDAISLIANTTGIDVVLDGHSHSMRLDERYPNKNGEDVVLSSVGTKVDALGEVIIGKDGEISVIQYSEYNKQDEKVVAAIANANDEISSILDVKVCDLDFDMPIADEEGVRFTRSRESTPGDLVADAFRYALDADVAFINAGGVRNAINAGEVKFNDLFNVLPFQNPTCMVNASGQQILDALEFCSRSTEYIYSLDGNAVGENGAFLQVSGLKYTIDTSVESPVITDENGFLTGFNEGPRRVKDVMVLKDGEYVPIEPESYYKVGGITYFLVDDGDGNTAFRGAEAIIQEGMTDVEALRTYVEAIGGISDEYSALQGRITIE